MIKGTVRGRSLIITGLNRDVFTSGSKGLSIQFTFDNEWTGLTKTAVFQNGSISEEIPIENSTVAVPENVLETPGTMLAIGVHGKNSENTKVITTIIVEKLVYGGAILCST